MDHADQFIHAKVTKEQVSLHLIVVYAAPTVSRRSGLWTQLSKVMGRIVGPLVVGGISIQLFVLMRDRGVMDNCLRTRWHLVIGLIDSP